MEDLFKDISVYFCKEEWTDIGEWEKIRYRNMKKNYETMLEIGISVPRPAFMSRGKHPQKPTMHISDESDEEWTPELETEVRMCQQLYKSDCKKNEKLTERSQHKDNNKQRTVDVELNVNKELQTLFDSQSDTQASQEECKGFTDEALTNSQKEDGTPVPSSAAHVKAHPSQTKLDASSLVVLETHNQGIRSKSATYGLRKRERKVYAEINELHDDDYLFCEDCQTFFLEECSIHGPPVFIKDTPIDTKQPNRSDLTLPFGMSIGPSSIPFAGLGVWNEASTFRKGVHFGPYEGKITDEEEAANSGYSWAITKGKNWYEYIDAKDESCSNWMRYVNCARNEEEQNLVAFQYHRHIYYRSCKTIAPRCELLVWYGDEYGKELGIKWNIMWKSHPPVQADVQDTRLYPCSACNMAFSIQEYLSKHMKWKHPPLFVESVKAASVTLEPVPSKIFHTTTAEQIFNELK